MTEREDTEVGSGAAVEEGAPGPALAGGGGWEIDNEGAGQRPEGDAGRGVIVAFGRTMKTLRTREGLEREEFGKRLGYSPSTIAAFEQGRRIPSPRTIERADELLGGSGLLCL